MMGVVVPRFGLEPDGFCNVLRRFFVRPQSAVCQLLVQVILPPTGLTLRQIRTPMHVYRS